MLEVSMGARTKARWAVGAAAALALAVGVACTGSDSSDTAAATSTPPPAARSSPAPAVPASPAPSASTPGPSAPAPAATAATGGSSDQQLVERGKEIFFRPGYCHTCHGEDAKGKIGPNIIGKTAEEIVVQTETNEAMKFLAGLSRTDFAALEAYLASLKQ